MPDLTVIVISYKSADSIGRTIDHIETAITNLDAEIIIVDNNSGDGTAEVAEAHLIHGSVLALEANVGYGPGVNVGLRHARGEFVLIMNDDILITETTITAMMDSLTGSSDVGLVGARLIYQDGTSAPTHRRFLPGWGDEWARVLGLISRREQRTSFPDTPEPFEVGLLLAACVLGSTEYLRGIGGFNEPFFFYGEDIDLCKRLDSMGHRRLVVPRAVAIHDQGTSPERRYRDREFTHRILLARDRYYRIWLSRPSRMLLNLYRAIRPADQPFLARFHLPKALYDGPSLRELRRPEPIRTVDPDDADE